MNDNFLLGTPYAKWLYHGCAKNMPVIDYHNHLSIEDLAADKHYENLAELWVISDPYKHRAMRICGIAERYITGDASAYEKFMAWMSVLPKLIGNPLYDWSILEMDRIFRIELTSGFVDAKWLWEETSRKLDKNEYSALKLLDKFHVEYAAPCALATDEIASFEKLMNSAPSLRGDNLVDVTKGIIDRLEELTAMVVNTLDDFYAAIRMRLKAFHKAGCRFSDHALDDGFDYFTDDGKNEIRFREIKKGNLLEEVEKKKLSAGILRFLAGEYAQMGWAMQLHIGALRYTSSRLRDLAGPAGGYAGIGSPCNVKSLAMMLDDFEKNGCGMPRIILFNLNPADNAVMSVLSGSYSQDGIAGKVQQGPAWWWCDHLYGMREVFSHISSYGVLSAFIGMTTDSRSILSFVRHEYFRRALCGWIGEKVSKGEIIAEKEMLKSIVADVCYNNAKKIIAK